MILYYKIQEGQKMNKLGKACILLLVLMLSCVLCIATITACGSRNDAPPTNQDNPDDSNDPDDVKPPEEDDDIIDIVLFTGQSNMVGRETSRYTADIPDGYAFEYKQNDDELTEVKNPVGEKIGSALETSSGSSIVPEFCKNYVEQTGRKIIAVHAAYGGRHISYFAEGGSMYRPIIDKYNDCLEFVKNSGEYEIGRKFYVMYQGESDTGSSGKEDGTSAETYEQQFMSFHDGLKEECGIEFGALIYNGRNSVLNEEGISRINGVKKALAEQHEDIIVCDKAPATYYTDRLDYMLSDNIHLNAEGLKKVASDSCNSIVAYLGYGSDSSTKNIDPVDYLPEPEMPLPPIDPPYSYEWNFDGNVDEKDEKITIEKTGNGTYSFENGSYVHNGSKNNPESDIVYWNFAQKINLPASEDWTVEWKGYSGQPMYGNASVLLADGQTEFITYQEENGIYVRNNDARAQFKSKKVLSSMYDEHEWKLSYDSSAKEIELSIDGVSEQPLPWSADLTFGTMLGSSWNGNIGDGNNANYSFTGKLDYFRISAGNDQELPLPSGASYEWNFDNGDIGEKDGKITATKVGSGNATFEDGKYKNSGNDVVYYELSENIVFPASVEWSVEWQGRSDKNMIGHASVLLSNGQNTFITFQESNGIYVSNGTDNNVKAKFNSSYINLEDQYSEHTWKLSYDPSARKLALSMDGSEKGELAWNSKITITHLLGSNYHNTSVENYNYTFTGELDYIKIITGDQTTASV